MFGLKKIGYGCALMGIAFGCNPKDQDRRESDSTSRIKPAKPMPPTSSRSVEPVPKHKSFGPESVHDLTISMFVSASGFGRERFVYFEEERRVVDHVELVSLLTESEASVYMLDEEPTVARARLAKRRPLDEFERLGLDAVRRGEDLVWTRDAPRRMFGAIRASGYCLECHTTANEGDLLGAFTYYLNTPVDRLHEQSVRE